MSPWQLRRNFRAQFRMTMRDYHGRLRALTALDAVLNGKSESAALEVGYRSRKNFNRQFQRCTGLTPTEFRRLPAEGRQEITDDLRRSLKGFAEL
jgi:AraC-like DNA-binding protein